MKLRTLFAATLLFTGLVSTSVMADDVEPYYFDLITLNQNTNIASNFINAEIQKLGGMNRVKDLQKAGDDKASMILGYLYLEGHVFQRDIKRGVEILKAARNTDGYSAFILGKHYLDLENEFHYSDKMKKEGAELVSFAALHGVTEAEYLAGVLYISGEHISEDRDLGMMHIRSASLKGHTPSRTFFSGVEKLYSADRIDFDKVQKQAMEGSIDALVELAKLYKDGWKVSRDLEKAKRLLELAHAKGSKEAGQLLLTME